MTGVIDIANAVVDKAFQEYWNELDNAVDNPAGLYKCKDLVAESFCAGWRGARRHIDSSVPQPIPGVVAQRVAKAAREACAPMVRYDKGSLEDMQQQAIEAMRAELLKIAEWLESVADKD